jgi:hypothetical protein
MSRKKWGVDMQEDTVSKRMKELFNSIPAKPNKMQKMEERISKPVKPLKDQKDAVTPQQWKFVQELVSGDGQVTLREAAIRAGYAEKHASAEANKLTDPKYFPQVVAAIQEYRRELAEKYGTNFDRHMRDLQTIRDLALDAGNYSAAVAAEYRRGQAIGTIYIDRKEIRHGTIDSMSKEEVRRKLEEIKAMYGPPPQTLIDVTPEQLEELPKKTMIEEMRDGQRSREPAVSEAQGELAELDDHEAGEPGGAGDTGLPDSTAASLGDGGAEGSEDWEEGKVEPAPDSVQPEARDGGPADVHSSAAPEDDESA